MIDISLPLDRNLITYPGDAKLELYDYYTHEKNGVQITRVLMETHTGTHIDAPFHAIANGGKLGSIPLENLMGPATVIRVNGSAVHAEDIPDDSEKRLLIRSRNSELYGKFDTGFCYIAMDAAEKMAEMKLHLVGLDYLSIEEFGTKGMPVHKKLLGNAVTIVEGLNLKDVEPGRYDLVCLPLKLDLDGGPCRAVLR
jgi:arylformamidase